mmetsp:Transcript_2510/g.5297  ORF Transcript_2510/g.5297 Transcript_2510/m.5297 type:complete len:239 (-) Transcript_2510:697-1413(-)
MGNDARRRPDASLREAGAPGAPTCGSLDVDETASVCSTLSGRMEFSASLPNAAGSNPRGSAPSLACCARSAAGARRLAGRDIRMPRSEPSKPSPARPAAAKSVAPCRLMRRAHISFFLSRSVCSCLHLASRTLADASTARKRFDSACMAEIRCSAVALAAPSSCARAASPSTVARCSAWICTSAVLCSLSIWSSWLAACEAEAASAVRSFSASSAATWPSCSALRCRLCASSSARECA